MLLQFLWRGEQVRYMWDSGTTAVVTGNGGGWVLTSSFFLNYYYYLINIVSGQ